jgi:hypothetical protein
VRSRRLRRASSPTSARGRREKSAPPTPIRSPSAIRSAAAGRSRKDGVIRCCARDPSGARLTTSHVRCSLRRRRRPTPPVVKKWSR